MPSVAPLPNTVNRLWLPRMSLASCVRAVMSRSTLGVALDDTQRLNYFPLTPLCSISWWIEGRSLLLPFSAPARLDADRQPLDMRVGFAGPYNRPSVSWNPGPGHGMMLMLMPDALHALTGLQPNDFVNRIVDAHDVLPEPWLAMSQAVLQAPDDDARVTLIEDFLDPLWQAVRPEQSSPVRRYHDWTQGLALRAATSGLGRSLRQVERRIKQWTGQPLRELRGVSRAERAFLDGQVANTEGRLNMAELAADAGYADQSHMCREVRRVTGFAPEELRRRIREEEAFWVYRLWQ